MGSDIGNICWSDLRCDARCLRTMDKGRRRFLGEIQDRHVVALGFVFLLFQTSIQVLVYSKIV